MEGKEEVPWTPVVDAQHVTVWGRGPSRGPRTTPRKARRPESSQSRSPEIAKMARSSGRHVDVGAILEAVSRLEQQGVVILGATRTVKVRSGWKLLIEQLSGR